MSRFALSLCAIALPLAGLANEPLPGESNDEVVTFELSERLFTGKEFEIGYDLTESGPGVWLRVDVSTDIDVAMEGKSSLVWPSVLDNSWDQTEKGGTLTLSNRGRAWIEITGRVAGIDLAFTLWEESLRWVETFTLRSLLLEGTRQGRTITLTPQGDALFDFEREFEVIENDVFITIGGAIRPFLSAVVTGDAIEVDDGVASGTVTRVREITAVARPRQNEGYADFEARWLGQLAGTMGLRTSPRVTVKVGRTTIGPLTVPLDLDIFSDTKPLRSRWSDVAHDLPVASPGTRTIDFGQVVIGDKTTREFTLNNLGNVELSGVATIEGAGFVMPRTNLLIARTNNGPSTQQKISIDLLPAALGTFTGTLTLHTNDPVNPILTIPMVGVGVNAGDDGGNGDPNDPGNGGGLVSQDGRGCGCSSVSPVSGLGGLGLLGLIGLAARRRRS
jgi:MYXO-CTERM domain-containing protein